MSAIAMTGTDMTGIELTPSRAHVSAGVAATRLRLTTRGRRVLAALVALPVALALAFAIVSGGAALASRDANAPAGTFATVTVAPGDSLWSIAEQVAPEEDPRDVVAAISQLNGLRGAAVAAGQTLAIPTEYSPAP